MMDDDYDDLDDIIMQAPSQGQSVKQEHELMNKAASHPLRRKIIKAIGAFGMEKAALAETTGIDPASLKYHIDFLISGEFLKTDGDTYRLTEKGLELLSDCESRAFLC